MDKVISRVANIVGDNLTAAKRRIAAGRTQIADYVKSLPKDLQKVGSEATKEIGERFEQLESEVDAKQEAVVDTLATKYVEARKGLDERIEELQAENKGLIDKAIGAIKAVINTIRELAAMLKNVLARVAGVVGQIIKAPVKFLGNLIAGIKGGILKFKDNILDHLRKGLMSWLFGALAEGGIELPETFDLKGIIKLLASIFGLTWTNIRNRIVKQIGEKAMGAVEKGVEIFSIISSQGVGGLWQMLMEKLGNIKEMILEQVKDFVITKIITAGITWLIGLLNPAAAFIKACKLIYDVVMFFVNNAARIKKFVDTVIDSVADVVRGNIGGVVNKINDVLGQMVPILIGFLASVIGLGGIGQKIREIIQKLQKPVNQALDFVIKKGLQLAGPIIRGLKGIGSKVKAKVAAGKAWVKGKAEKDKAEKGGAVKATAEADLARRVGGSISSASQVRGAVGAVYAKYQPQGLRAIKVNQTDVSHYSFDVVARKIDKNNPKPEKFMNKDFQVRLDSIGKATGIPHTALVATWNGAPLPRMEQDHEAHHAEDAMAAYIKEHRDSLPGPGRGRKNRLDVTLTKSPCPRCGRRLATFAAGNNVQLTLALAGLYRGKKGTVEEREASIDALIKLQVKGVELRVPTLREVLSQLGNPKLTKESRRILKQKLKNMRDVLKGVNDEARAIRKAGK